LYLVTAHLREPAMPERAGKRPDSEIEMLSKWIEGGLLENDTSVALKPKKSTVVALSESSIGKPDGPPPVPTDLPLQPVHTFPRADAVTALAASPWAPVAAKGSEEQILVHHLDTHQLLGIIPWTEGAIYDLAFSKNGKYLLVAGGRPAQEGKATLFDLMTGRRLFTIGGHYDAVLSADISADQKFIATGSTDKKVRIFSTQTGEVLHENKKHTDWVTTVSYSPDGVLLSTGDRNGNLHIWESSTNEEFYALKGHEQMITSVSWRRDSNVLASASQDGSVRLWNMHDGKEIRNWKPHGGGVLSVEFFADGYLITAGRDNKVKIWDPEGKEQKSIDTGGVLPIGLATHYENSRFAVGDFNGNLHLYTREGEKLGELETTPAPIASRLKSARAAWMQAQEPFTQLLKQRDEVKAASDTASHEAARLATVRAEYKAKLEAEEARMKELEPLLASLGGMMTEASKRVDMAKEALTQTQAARDAALQKRDTIQHELTALSGTEGTEPATLESTKTRLEDAERELKQSQDLVATAEQNVRDAESTLAKSSAEQTEARHRADVNKQALDHLRPEMQQAMKLHDEAEALASTKRQELEKLVAAVEEQSPRVTALSNDVKHWEAAEFNLSVHAAASLLEEQEEMVRAHEEAVESAKAAHKAAQHEVTAHREKLGELKARYEAMKASK